MRVVCDAGPLIALAKLNHLGLLFESYEEILMPEEVYDEVVTNGIKLGMPDAYEVRTLVNRKIFKVEKIKDSMLSLEERQSIDIGEAKVISLAIREKADMVLIDDLHARKVARIKGLRIKGTLGLLVDSYRKDLITFRQLEVLIEEIKLRTDLWINSQLCDDVLKRIQAK